MKIIYLQNTKSHFAVAAKWFISCLLLLFLSSCNDPLEVNEPDFTTYNGPVISELQGSWDLTETIAIGLVDPTDIDTIKVGELIQVGGIDSININGTNFAIYNRVGVQTFEINSDGRFNYIVNNENLLINVVDTLAQFFTANETGYLDIYDDRMIIISDSSRSDQGSFLTGPLDYAIIDYGRTATTIQIAGATPFFNFRSGNTQPATTLTTYQKR